MSLADDQRSPDHIDPPDQTAPAAPPEEGQGANASPGRDSAPVSPQPDQPPAPWSLTGPPEGRGGQADPAGSAWGSESLPLPSAAAAGGPSTWGADVPAPVPALEGAVADEAAPGARARGAARVARWGRELAETLILAFLIFLAVRAVVQNFRVEGASMQPTLHDGQYLLVNKAIYFRINLKTVHKFLPFIDPGDNPNRYLFRSPRRGDIVVFRSPQSPNRDFIKRVIGVPGDVVEVRDGVVYVNGEPLVEPYIADAPNYQFPPTEVPPHTYWVLGDNRNNSDDSHHWGPVPEDNIIGQAWFSYWPRDKIGLVDNRNIRPGSGG